MNKHYGDKEKVLGPAIKILDENNMSSRVYHAKFPKTHENINLESKCKIYHTNVLDNIKNKPDKETKGYYTNKRVFISYKEFLLFDS